MIELKIDPEFRDKIPPLTKAEFEQLEENILTDGEVYEPICIWNGTIVDGHNRWKIVQEHPEIPYRIKEMEFFNKWEAFEWMYKKQLGRRNLTDEQKTYMIGKMYEARKKRKGSENNRNQDGTFSSNRKDQNDLYGLQPKTTAEAIAREIGVAEPTVKRSGEFALGLDKANKIVPGFKDEVLNGVINTPKINIRKIRNMQTEDEIKTAIEEIRNPKPKGYTREDRQDKAQINEIVAEMYNPETKPFTIEMLEGDIEMNGMEYVNVLKNTLIERSTMLVGENRARISAKIELIITEIRKIKELVS